MIYKHAYELVHDDVFLDLGGFIPGVELILKIEGLNPAGSIKLKTALALVEDAEKRGVLPPGGSVIESSSGNLGVALSSVCAARGYAFTCVVDPNTSAQSMSLMRAYGATVHMVEERDANGGFLQSRIDHIQRRLDEDPALLWLNQYANPANPRAHHDWTAAAIARAVPHPDYLFIGAGTTGTLMGCAEFFHRHSPSTKIVAVDAEGSITFGHPAGRRYIPGLGTSRRPEVFQPGLVEDVELIPEREAVRMCRALARHRGLALGGSTGSVLAAVARRRNRLPTGAKVVAIAPDIGERYLSTVYDDDWVAQRFGALSPADVVDDLAHSR